MVILANKSPLPKLKGMPCANFNLKYYHPNTIRFHFINALSILVQKGTQSPVVISSQKWTNLLFTGALKRNPTNATYHSVQQSFARRTASRTVPSPTAYVKQHHWI